MLTNILCILKAIRNNSDRYLYNISTYSQFLILISIILSCVIVQNLNIFPYAYGHALPVTYSPSPNSIISTTKPLPTKITISFSERPDPKVSFIHVTDPNNKRVDNNDFKITGEQNGRVAQVTLDTHKLGEGVFTVSWLTMSIDDGHIARGSYVFGIGDVGNTAGSSTQALTTSNNQMQQNQIKTEAVTSNIDGVIKWPLIVAQAAMVGGIISHLFLWVNNRVIKNKIYFSLKSISNTDSSTNQNDLKNSEKVLRPIKMLVLLLCVSSVIVIVFGSTLLFLQINDLYNTSSNYLNIFNTLLHGPVGTVWILRMLTAAIIFSVSIIYYFLEKKRLIKQFFISDNNQNLKIDFNNKHILPSILLYIALIAGSINIFSNSMTSHSSGVSFFPDIAISLDWLHIMAVSIWVGGIFYIAIVILAAINIQNPRKYVQKSDQNDQSVNSYTETNNLNNNNTNKTGEYFLTLLLPRFSLLATASLGIIGVSGLYIAWIHLHSFNNIFDTVYGNILIVKLLSALPMVIIGSYHQIKLHRYMVKLVSVSKQAAKSFETDIQKKYNKKKYNVYSRFSKTIKIESLIGIVVLFFASILTITSPPGSMSMSTYEHASN